jgi:membrane protein
MRIPRRVDAVQRWLARRADSKLGRLSLQWFRGYFEASQNSGSAATLYSLLSVVPVVLAVIGLLDAAGANTTTFAEHLVDHLNLTGATARVVRDTFGSASSNALAASLAAVVGFLIWGIGIGQIYQDVYARAWKIEVRSLADQVRFAMWFFAFAGACAAPIVFAESLRAAGWLALIPAWIVGSAVFWTWTPRFLLHRRVGFGHLLPGALLGSVVIGGATATSPLFLGATLNTYSKYFGPFGVVVGLIGWAFVLITLSMVCAVFSPVWIRWRESEQPRSSWSGAAWWSRARPGRR